MKKTLLALFAAAMSITAANADSYIITAKGVGVAGLAELTASGAYIVPSATLTANTTYYQPEVWLADVGTENTPFTVRVKYDRNIASINPDTGSARQNSGLVRTLQLNSVNDPALNIYIDDEAGLRFSDSGNRRGVDAIFLRGSSSDVATIASIIATDLENNDSLDKSAYQDHVADSLDAAFFGDEDEVPAFNATTFAAALASPAALQ